MSDNAAAQLWTRVKELFVREAGHLVTVFVPEPGADALPPDDSYLRVSLADFFLADERQWGSDRIPAVQVSVRLLFATDRPQTFATLVTPPVTTGHGSFSNYRLTGWLPYRGQPVELEAALHEVLGANKLLTAIDIVTDFASLVTPPVSAALAVVDKVASGIEKIVEANSASPALVLHETLGLPELRPGRLAVIRADEQELAPRDLALNDSGQLCLRGTRLTGYDYLVLRVEGCRERADWKTPDLDAAIATAFNAKLTGKPRIYKQRRDEALAKIALSPDLTHQQRMRAAAAVREELDSAVPRAAAEGGMTMAEIAARGLPSRSEVENLTLADLLAG